MHRKHHHDVLIIGSGAAGLSLALRLADHARIALISKGPLTEGATLYAQGGISVVLDKGDSFSSHIKDTLTAGAGLCDEEIATYCVEQARDGIQWLVDKGVPFTRETDVIGNSDYHLAREGGHSHRRIIHAADATGRAVEKTLEYHRARLADTEVNAPFDGLIVRRQRDPGDVVVPGSAILTLISTDELWISAWVDETEIAKLEDGQPTRVVFRSEPARSYPGKVVRLGREADRETREFIVDVRVVELPENWAVGQRAEVYIETARKHGVTLLPAKYIVWRADRPGVFVSRNGHVEWRGITFGLRSPAIVEVTDGLQTGEKVVMPADPGNTLSDGQRIRP